ncbi:MAG: hypothetical protein KDK91_07210 [Gammaproteobacteria bacterium]|nr:hypothetical protein [Gammaproteobacteria bacterium]
MGFTKMATQAQEIVIGKVVEQRVLALGNDIRKDDVKKDSLAPYSEQEQTKDGRAVAEAIDAELNRAEAIETVEGGRMLFTEITFDVEHRVEGKGESTIKLIVAGGNDGELQVTVHGMPTFKTGERYMLFLRPGYGEVADPVMGVNQGFFQIGVDEYTGQQVLRNADGALVADVIDDRLQLALDIREQSKMRLGAAPVPDNARGALARTSPEVAEYWERLRPALTVGEFIDAIHAAKEAGK